MSTPSSSCPSRERLEQLLLGRLSSINADPLVQHLENCDTCQTSVRGLGTDDTLIQAIRDQSRLSGVDDPLLDQLIDKVAGLVTPMEENCLGMLDPPDNPGELGRLGPYRILRILGTGGMGLVFQAEELPLGRHVALKVIRPSLAAILSVRERFLREARAVAAIDDERIAPIYHVGEERGTPYIAMQLLDGQTLEEHLRDFEQASGCRALPVADAVRIGCEIAHGLAAAHARGVIHRDVKPGNIFLKGSAPFAVKLLDFGLARGVEDEQSLTQPGAVAGTPAYISPEQIAGGPLDPRCDLYGLGCTLYRMTVGRTPSALPAQGAMRPARAAREIVPPHDANPDVPPELSDFILRLLATDPARRPPSARDVAERLTGIGTRLAASEPAISSSAPTKSTRPPDRRRRTALLAAAGVTLLVLTAAIIRILTDRGEFVVVTSDPDVEIVLRQTGGMTLRDRRSGRTYVLTVGKQELPSGEYEIDVREPAPGLEFSTRRFAIARGKETRVTVSLRPVADEVAIDPFEAWLQGVAVLRADQQVQAVAEKLKELNSGFDGQVESRFAGGRTIELHFLTDFVTDIRPVRALRDLEILVCRGSESARGRLSDVSPVMDLSSLTYLDFSANRVHDLSSLRSLPLRELVVWANPIEDLRPLRSLPLSTLDLNFTFVVDLSPLENLQLTRLLLRAPYAIDFSPLERLPLREIHCDFRPNRHAKSLRAIRTLSTINDQRAADFWSAHEARRTSMKEWLPRAGNLPADRRIEAVAARLRELNPEFDDKLIPTIEDGEIVELQFFVDKVTDIAPVRAFKELKRLKVLGTEPGKGRLFDLDPIRDLPLTFVNFRNTQVTELSALRRMPIEAVVCGGTAVRDLSPLRTLSIRYLDCRASRVEDLTPLKGLKIAYLDVTDCRITDFSPLQELPLDRLYGTFDHERDADVLQSITTLKEINGQPAAEFWKTFTARARN